MSLTAPNPNAQAELLVDVYRRAAVDPAAVGLIEAHGTGTAMGDAVELNGLKKAFRELGVSDGPASRCAVSSVKTNIGHLEAASGVTSLIRTVLAMRHRTIPGVLHFEQLNPQIRLDDSPFHIAQTTQAWHAATDASGTSLPLTAGISSLGFGGVNAHLIVQEYRAAQAAVAPAPQAQKLAHLIVLSAKTPEQLIARASDLLTYLRANRPDQATLARIAATLQVGRENLRDRLAFVIDSADDLAARLEAFIAGDSIAAAAYRSRGERDSDSVGLINRDADIKAMIVSKWLSSNDLGPLLELWTQGVDIDWRALYGSALPPRINLPAYPFARERHWVDTVDATSAATPVQASATARDTGPRIAPAPARRTGVRGAAELAAELISDELARQLQVPAAQLPTDRNLLELGVTSLGIAALVREINRRLDLDLSPSLIFEHPTIARFATYLGDNSASAIGRAMAAAVMPVAHDGDGEAATDDARAVAAPSARESARDVLESIVWQDNATGDEYERMTF
jgi:polyketide synthase PksN